MSKTAISRRDFFKQGLRSLGKGLKETATALYGDDLAPPKTRPKLIRPPGALAEAEFLKKCTRCNECVKVCPQEAIMKFVGEESVNHLTPMLSMRKAACVLCEGFPCVEVCEPRALVMPESRNRVRMGIAVLDTKLCHAWQGVDCDYCAKECPADIGAITLDEVRRPHVAADKCTGCGLCEKICPSRQAAIVVGRV